MVCSFFSLDAVFMNKFLKQNEHFYKILEKKKNATIERQNSNPKKFPDFFPLSPSSSPVRKEHFALKNFNQGPKMAISGLVA